MNGNDKYKLEDFQLYQHAREYRKKIYNLINKLPEKEIYALVPQMRRAIISVTNNIAEGHGRRNIQENIHFCRISRGSLEEVIDDLNICIDEGYFLARELEALKEASYSLIHRINGYISYLKKQKDQKSTG